jgi:hypothetical protein
VVIQLAFNVVRGGNSLLLSPHAAAVGDDDVHLGRHGGLFVAIVNRFVFVF